MLPILFDIDGTLIDSNHMHTNAWEEAFATVGVRFERSDVYDQIGKGADMLIPTLLPGLVKRMRTGNDTFR